MVIDPLIIVRSLHIAATVLASGTLAFMLLVAEPAFRSARANTGFTRLRRAWTRMVWIALAVAILTGAAWLALLAATIYDAPAIAVGLHGGVWTVLTDTRFGLVWCARLALALLTGLLLFWPAARVTQLCAAAALIALLAFVGHAGAAPGPTGQIHLASDIVHLLAAGIWLGGLPALVMLLAQQRRDAPRRGNIARALGRFSALGMAAVCALLASGLINSWMLLGSPRDLIANGYGRLVLLKAGLFLAMVALAAVNRFRLTPRVNAPDALRALKRNSLAEIGLGLCVILAAGTLGTMEPTAHVHVVPPTIPAAAAFTHIHTSDAMADVTIDPGRAGRANATIRVLREDFSEFPAKTVRLALDPPATSLQKIARNAVRMTDGSWQVNALELPQAGVWTVHVIINDNHDTPIVLDAPIMIDRR